MQMKMREICMERWTIAVIMMVVGMFVGGTCEGSSGLHSEQSAPPARVQTCREGCLQKAQSAPKYSRKMKNKKRKNIRRKGRRSAKSERRC